MTDSEREQLEKQGYSPEDIAVIEKYFPGEDDYIEFDGMNCDDLGDEFPYCAGWDGISHRCSCGNRRVYWVVEGGVAYGMAD